MGRTYELEIGDMPLRRQPEADILRNAAPDVAYVGEHPPIQLPMGLYRPFKTEIQTNTESDLGKIAWDWMKERTVVDDE